MATSGSFLCTQNMCFVKFVLGFSQNLQKLFLFHILFSVLVATCTDISAHEELDDGSWEEEQGPWTDISQAGLDGSEADVACRCTSVELVQGGLWRVGRHHSRKMWFCGCSLQMYICGACTGWTGWRGGRHHSRKMRFCGAPNCGCNETNSNKWRVFKNAAHAILALFLVYFEIWQILLTPI